MPTIRDIYNILFDFAPAYMKMDWDNVGLVCGKFDTEVHRILVALDPMMDVFEEAKALSCELVVTHHPLIFQSIKQVNDESYDGRNLLYLIENGIASLNLHTNLDCCPGGVNDVLASQLGLSGVEILNPVGTDEKGRPYGLVRMGEVAEQPLAAFAAFVKRALSCPGVRFSDAGKPVRNHFEEAKYRGLNLIDAGHFETENPICGVLEGILREAFPEIPVFRARAHRDETQFL